MIVYPSFRRPKTLEGADEERLQHRSECSIRSERARARAHDDHAAITLTQEECRPRRADNYNSMTGFRVPTMHFTGARSRFPKQTHRNRPAQLTDEKESCPESLSSHPNGDKCSSIRRVALTYPIMPLKLPQVGGLYRLGTRNSNTVKPITPTKKSAYIYIYTYIILGSFFVRKSQMRRKINQKSSLLPFAIFLYLSSFLKNFSSTF